MFKVFYESATGGRTLISEVDDKHLADCVGSTYYEAYKKLRDGYFIDIVVCVRIYDPQGNQLAQLGSI